MYSHIFLDLDDTLLDFQAGQRTSFEAVLAHYDIPFDENLYGVYNEVNQILWRQLEQGGLTRAQLQERRFSLFFADIGLNLSGVEAEGLYKNHLEKQASLLPYAKEVCRRLAQSHTLTIITNGISEIQNRRLAACGLLPYLSHIVISDDIGINKPDKRFFDHALAVSRCGNPLSILVVGDSLASDIQGANNAGLDACWYNPGKKPMPEGYNIRYSIADLRELFNIL